MKRKTLPAQVPIIRNPKKNKTQNPYQILNGKTHSKKSQNRFNKNFQCSEIVISCLMDEILKQIHKKIEVKANEQLLDFLIEDVYMGYQILSKGVSPIHQQVNDQLYDSKQKKSNIAKIIQDEEPNRSCYDPICGFDKLITRKKSCPEESFLGTQNQSSSVNSSVKNFNTSHSLKKELLNTTRKDRSTNDIKSATMTSRANIRMANNKFFSLNPLLVKEKSEQEQNSNSGLIPLEQFVKSKEQVTAISSFKKKDLSQKKEHFLRERIFEKIPHLPQILHQCIQTKKTQKKQSKYKLKGLLGAKANMHHTSSLLAQNSNNSDFSHTYDYNGSKILALKNVGARTGGNVSLPRTNVLKTTCRLLQNDKQLSKNKSNSSLNASNGFYSKKFGSLTQRKDSKLTNTNQMVLIYDNINNTYVQNKHNLKSNNTTQEKQEDYTHILEEANYLISHTQQNHKRISNISNRYPSSASHKKSGINLIELPKGNKTMEQQIKSIMQNKFKQNGMRVTALDNFSKNDQNRNVNDGNTKNTPTKNMMANKNQNNAKMLAKVL